MKKKLYTLQECFEMEGSKFPFTVFRYDKKRTQITFKGKDHIGFIPKKWISEAHERQANQSDLHHIRHFYEAWVIQKCYYPFKALKFNKDMASLLGESK